MARKPAKGRSTPRSGRGKRTREAVLAAAVAVFGREGVRQTSMLAIAQEAGVASGTVYQYFADKEDIFRVLLDQLEDELQSATEMPVGQDGPPNLGEMVRRYLNVHRENVAIYRAWWDLLEPRTEFTDAWLATHERLAGSIAELVQSGRGEVRPNEALDPEVAGHLAAILFERPAYSRNIMGWDEELTDEEVSDLIGRLLGNGLFERPSR
jgi:AcrR family transcriptional regulator